jgi:hypothetical protein
MVQGVVLGCGYLHGISSDQGGTFKDHKTHLRGLYLAG